MPAPARFTRHLCALGLALAPALLWAQDGNWLADQNGCKHWNSAPVPNESTQWDGACVDGYAEGAGVQTWSIDGRLRTTFTGSKKAGRLQGQGRLLSASGLLFEGTFVEGKREGRGRLQWPDGTRFEGEFVDGRMKGPGAMQFGNGNRYAGPFQDGLLQGEAQVSWPQGLDPARLERLLAGQDETRTEPIAAGQVRVLPVAKMTPACTPQYPRAALRAEATGTTQALMLIDTDGRVSKVRIDVSSGDTPPHKLLDLVTISAIWNCPFSPGTLDGKPVPMWAKVQYVWRIE